MSTQGLDVRAGKIWFAEPLTPGVIVRRPNRFIIEVDIDDRIVACHCPTTGRTGNLILYGLPCLLSRSHNPARKTPFTVEAISVDPPAATRRSWIGINQNAANRYIEEALRHDLLPDILSATTVQREKVLGASRLDFLVDDTTYVEVKTPLENLQIGLGDHITTRTPTPLGPPTGSHATSASWEPASPPTSAHSSWSASSTTIQASKSKPAHTTRRSRPTSAPRSNRASRSGRSTSNSTPPVSAYNDNCTSPTSSSTTPRAAEPESVRGTFATRFAT